jgi:predicted  nucleic acid-binding Zn-ribbon protein
MDLSASPAITGEVDTAAILKQLNLVKSEVNSMRSEFTEYKSKMKTDLE